MARRLIWDGTHGGRLAIWARNVGVIKGMVARLKLEPVKVKVNVIGLPTTRAAIRWPRIPFPGIPVPHVHLGGKIYPLSEAQWTHFSRGVIKDIGAKLNRAGSVGPEQLSILTELTAGTK